MEIIEQVHDSQYGFAALHGCLSAQVRFQACPGAVRRVTVDGEAFDVRSNETGTVHHFDWVSGPNPSYGFTSGMRMIFEPVGDDAVVRSEAEDAFYMQQIREFLAQIDPEMHRRLTNVRTCRDPLELIAATRRLPAGSGSGQTLI